MQQNSLSVTKAIIIICVVVFLVGTLRQIPVVYTPEGPVAIPGSPYYEPLLSILGYFSWYSCFTEGELWRIISYQFIHANVGHLIFNMWALYFFGPHIESIMGAKKYLAFYLVCGAAAALFSAFVGEAILYDAYWPYIRIVGASGSIYGVIIATAFLYPYAKISLLFPPVTLTMRSFALIILGIASLVILANGHNAAGEAGHLGGAIMGLIIMVIWKWKQRNQYPGS